jgi:hypothetical protein
MFVEVTVSENTVIRHYVPGARAGAMLRDAFIQCGYEAILDTEEVDDNEG